MDEYIKRMWARELLRMASQRTLWEQFAPPRPPRSRRRRIIDWLRNFTEALAA